MPPCVIVFLSIAQRKASVKEKAKGVEKLDWPCYTGSILESRKFA
jgi:hypothetical protein